jgi:hypothetical protein
MKKILLSAILTASVLLGAFHANAQINVLIDFENGSMPSGWSNSAYAYIYSDPNLACEGTTTLLFANYNGTLTSPNYTSFGRTIEIEFFSDRHSDVQIALECINITRGNLTTTLANVPYYWCKVNTITIPSSVVSSGETFFLRWAATGVTTSQHGVIDYISIKEYTPKPTATSPQTFCTASTVANLAATGTNLKWYNTLTGGSPLSTSQSLVHGTTYYVSQTISGMESERIPVAVNVYNITEPTNTTPAANLSICAENSTTLSVSGAGTVQWFVDNTTPIVLFTGNTYTTPILYNTTTYYVRQYQGTCYSARIPITVTVNAIETPTFTQIPAVCPDDTFTLPTTSTNGITGTWSPPINNTATTTYTFTPNTGECSTTNATMTIVALQNNVVPTFNLPNTICQGTPLTLPTTSLNGITGTWSPAANNTQTTTYTFTPNAGQCNANVITTTIVVNPTGTPVFTIHELSALCKGVENPLPNVSVNGIEGTWSPAWDPDFVGSRVYTFTSSSGCNPQSNQTITINQSQTSLPNVVNTTTPENSSFCENSNATRNLSVSGTGNIQWFTSMTAVTPVSSTSTYSPTGLNSTTSYYVRQYAGGCYTPRITVTVTATPSGATPVFTQINTICQGESLTLPTTSTNGIQGAWSPAVNNQATTTYTFTPSVGQCSSQTATMTVQVTPITTPSFTQIAPQCEGTSFTLPTTSNNGITGTWSPAVNNQATTTYTFTAGSGTCNTNTTMTVVIKQNAVITAQPTISNSNLCLGAPINLSVSATGTINGYQWYKNGSPISGATSNTFSIASAQLTDGGTYSVKVLSSCGDVISNNVTINVAASGPTILFQPFDNESCIGLNAYFGVDATGPIDSYQWYKDGIAITGATNSDLSITNVTTNDAGAYTVDVISSCGSLTSDVATLIVHEPVTMTQQPSLANTEICEGGSFTLEAQASQSNANFTWRKDGIAFSNGSTLTISSMTAADAGVYTVEVTSPICGNIETSNAVTITFKANPVIVTQPIGGTFCQGDDVTLSVGFSNTVASYEWSVDGTVISGETVYSLTLSNIQVANSGNYSVKAMNTCGEVTSTVAAVVVNPTYTMTIQKTICDGDEYLFNGTNYNTTGVYQANLQTVNGCDSIATLNLTVIDASTTFPVSATICDGDSYAFGGTNYTTAGQYTHTFQSVGGCDSIVVLTLTVNSLPTVNTTYNNGILEATIGFATYQWYKDGAIISGATGATYTPTQTGTYHVEVSDAAGCSSISTTISVTDVGLKGLIENAMHIYPNPATTTLTIELVQQTTIELVDMLGQTIQTHQLKSGVNTIDVSELVSGVYFIQTVDGSTIKFVKAK